jgi:site-specific recombinase XerD
MDISGTGRFGAVKGQPSANEDQTFPAEPLTPTEAEALVSACSSRSATGLRNRALIIVLWRAGLRISEALDLRCSDVDPERGTIRVLHGKGNRARTVGLGPGEMAVVLRWIDARKAAGIRNGGSKLFCTLAGRELNDRYVRALLPRLAAQAGIDKRVHPHGLRHTHAVELDNEKVPVSVISRQLGHSSVAVTARYLDHVAPGDLIKTMQERPWKEPA